MGKAGRAICIFTPWALTIVSFVCLLLISIAGWSKSSSELNSLYFFQANFANLDVSAGSSLENSTTLTAALEAAKSSGTLKDVYQIHLWNYCTSDGSNDTVDACSKRKSSFYFDPVEVWGLNATSTAAAAAESSATSTSEANAIESAANALKNKSESLEKEVLGKAGKEALDAYKKVAKWMFIGFEVSFWATLATIICGILALFSRWGSFLTWVFSFVSTLFTVASVLTSTVLFSALVGALKTLLDPYGISLKLGTHALIVEWIAVIASLAATFFWLFSICCCSGRSNPHHRSNKGGLWAAEEKGQGYYGRGRGGLKVEKTGAGYERVASPYLGHNGQEEGVAMQSYGQQNQVQHPHQGGAYEPFRRN